MRLRSAAAIVALSVCAGTPAAAARPERWEQKPTPADERAALPPSEQGHAGGVARMRCKVTADRYLAECNLTLESPSGHGLGEALLKLAPKYRLSETAARREAADGAIVVANSWATSPPGWLRKPTPQQLLGVWPTEALKRGLDGRAVIQCIVTVQGVLTDCLVTSEEPKGAHFGVAAVALAPQLLMKPATRNGVPVPSDVHIPINWTGMAGLRGADHAIGSRKVVSAASAWSGAPTIAQVAAAYPPKAASTRLAGHVTLNCALRRTGELGSCSTLLEEPKRAGFAQAAKSLTREFQAEADPGLRDAEVQLPFTFDPTVLDAAPVVGKPQWAQLPTSDALTTAFRGLDVKADVLRAVLNCMVQQGGAVDGCSVAGEAPTGSGLGAAALALAPAFRVSTWTSEGLPTVGGRVRIPLRYEVRAPAAANATPAPAVRP